MLFSSVTFLYYFLPLTVLLYYVAPDKWKNYVLLFVSLVFYSLGELKFLYVLVTSCVINYSISILFDKNVRYRKHLFVIGVAINVLALLYFKYTNFFISNINNIFDVNVKYLNIVMPLGISFFTFQSISYLIDIYTKKSKIPKNIFYYSTYICLFPQLIAGPIVRYEDISQELNNRKHSFSKFSEGVKRFSFGLTKKILIANVLGGLVLMLNYLSDKTVVSYIIGNISYMLQIYFDFSGYSDMAIGLGLMFGFRFLENFNYPFIAKSITDFWRRWHISLSMFLRDYVYIPMGGSRNSMLKWFRNIFVVWFLTGFWHGASWNFIIWGIYFALALVIEKFLLKSFLDNHRIIAHIYTLFIVLISFIIFNNESLNEVLISVKSMLGFGGLDFINSETIYYLRSYVVLIVVAIVASTPAVSNLAKLIGKSKKYKNLIDVAEVILYVVILLVCTAFLINSSFNPFLYFRF